MPGYPAGSSMTNCSVASSSKEGPAGIAPRFKSFHDFKLGKGKQWKAKVNSKKEAKDPDVAIFIGLMEWNHKIEKVKAKRGKRLALKVKSGIGYEEFLAKAEEKWRAYQSDLYDEDEEYILCYEDGQRANFLPGSNEKFTLKRYREEKGHDYNRITLYLCTKTDFTHVEKDVVSVSDDDFDLEFPAFKIRKTETRGGIEQVESVIEKPHTESDEKVALELHRSLNEAILPKQSIEITMNINSVQDVVKSLASKVDRSENLLFTVRRGADIFRILSLWQRQVRLGSPERAIRVHYLGEYGIDSGAIAKEFFSNSISDIGRQMFPFGSPLSSTLHVKNGNFKACGQLVAASIAQGGPAPTFLAECVYKQLIHPMIDMKELCDKSLTENEKKQLTILTADLDSSTDQIIDHGYTGVIDVNHIEEIKGSVMVSIVSQRAVYLAEFMEGLNLYGLKDILLKNGSVCKELFVKGGDDGIINANYLFSLLCPNFSEMGSTRRKTEEHTMDLFQDYLFHLEDNPQEIKSHLSAITWNYPDTSDEGDETKKPESLDEKFEEIKASPKAVLKWITGSSHKPLDGDEMKISVFFDHECLVRNPTHRICFPVVSACAKEITFPTAHFKTTEEFYSLFSLAVSQAQSFGRP
eukprot:gene6762-7523_t